ncbi:VOC family protein [Demequina muriae]|uniref:VOC family protein n=1 Tax=Demequina muriae TaxID=3051664 RepID=A0ABT8GGN8_9MICO|nr:VOC family protein [Demequina sp. EGI L300058]MDN4480599.1 VOC family protein [Demequina sp. EGI L300058]
MNTLTWFEIPVTDLERATAFYRSVLKAEFSPEDDGEGHRKSIFETDSGVSGALSHGADWVPSESGTMVYFDANPDLAPVLDRVTQAGGEVVEPKQEVGGDHGYWARFRDTEGNIVGLLSEG